MKDCMTTFTGLQFNAFEPEADKIRIEDIAHALSMMVRANGHFPQFFSVGQHCIQHWHEIMCRQLHLHVCCTMEVKHILRMLQDL